MSEPGMDEPVVVQQEIDQHPNGPTEADEMEVLTDLYGPPDFQGVFKVGDLDGDE